MAEETIWLGGVYLETSVLTQLPSEVITVELLNLQEVCKLLEIPIVVPRVSFDEW